MPKYIVTTNNKHSQEFADLEVALNFVAESVNADHVMTIARKPIVIPAFEITFGVKEIDAVFKQYNPEWGVESEDAHVWLVRECLIGERDYEWDVDISDGSMQISFVDRAIHL